MFWDAVVFTLGVFVTLMSIGVVAAGTIYLVAGWRK